MNRYSLRMAQRLIGKVNAEQGLKTFRSRDVSLDQSDLKFLVSNGILVVVATRYEDRFVPKSRYSYNRYNNNEETVLQDIENNKLYEEIEDLPIGRHFKSIKTNKKLVKDCAYNVYQLQTTTLMGLYIKEKRELENKWADFI